MKKKFHIEWQGLGLSRATRGSETVWAYDINEARYEFTLMNPFKRITAIGEGK